MATLGAALTDLGKFAEAEPILLEAYEKMKPPPQWSMRKGEALESLIRLYEKWGKEKEAKRWRAER